MKIEKKLSIATLLLLCFVTVVDAQSRQTSGNSDNSVRLIIGIIIGAIALFFICRELICWYYKINRLVALMEEQNSLLKEFFGKKGITSIEHREGIDVIVDNKWICGKCGTANDTYLPKCKKCGKEQKLE
jgi:hypothetical protein